jgi:hypothetical protein
LQRGCDYKPRLQGIARLYTEGRMITFDTDPFTLPPLALRPVTARSPH